MSSSISSSRRADAWRVLLLVALTLGAIEAVVRTSLIPRSVDLMNLGRVFPARAERLSREAGTTVALVGNSATARGIEIGLVRQALGDAGAGPVAVDAFTADASHINTWSYMIERYFCDKERPPELVVLIYFKYSLEDGHPDDIGRLAQFLTRRSDWGEVFRTDLPDASERLQFLVSSAWASFAVRERIRERVLSLVTPGYKAFVLRLQRAALESQLQRPEAVTRRGHRALERLLRRARTCGTRLAFVAYPVAEVYPLDAEAIGLVRQSGECSLDLRRVEGLSAAHYEDEVHLTAEGRAVFSRRLGEALAPVVQSVGSSPRAAVLIHAGARQ